MHSLLLGRTVSISMRLTDIASDTHYWANPAKKVYMYVHNTTSGVHATSSTCHDGYYINMSDQVHSMQTRKALHHENLRHINEIHYCPKTVSIIAPANGNDQRFRLTIAVLET
jgi:hypothetical protein